jgi:hypothetical protein
MSRRVSQRWKETVKGVVDWVTYVDWTNDGGVNWLTAPYFYSGTVNCDATSQVRWTTDDLTIGGVPINQNATKTEDGISPFHTRFRIRHGIRYGPSSEELIGMGYYRCTDVQESTVERHSIQIVGQSFESYFISPMGAFPKPRPFGVSSARNLLEKLIHEILINASIVWDSAVPSNTTIPAFVAEGDRWVTICGGADDPSISRSLGAKVWCGGDGEWRVALPGSLSDPVTFESTLSENQFSASRSLSNQGVYNIISVSGVGTDGNSTLGPVIVTDADPASPTYVGRQADEGGFGRSVRYYSSDKFTDTKQMARAGQSMLAQTLGLRQQVTFSRAYDPSIEPWDVGVVDAPQGKLKAILDGTTYDLSGNSTMDGQARTTSSEYSGEVGTWVDDVDGGLGGGES